MKLKITEGLDAEITPIGGGSVLAPRRSLSPGAAGDRVPLGGGMMQAGRDIAIEQLTGLIRAVGEKARTDLQTMAVECRPDEITLSFGVGVTAEAKLAIVGGVGTEATLRVTMTWKTGG